MKIHVEKLTTQEINQLVAKLEGVEVILHKGHVSEEFEFEPEGPCNDYDLKLFKMWKFYEPTKDWSIAGPIIQREQINLSTYVEEGISVPYWGAWYGSYQHECTGDTPTEAAMRSFICKSFGNTIDIENLPKILRTAIVKINGLTKPLHKIADEDFVEDFTDVFFEEEVEIEVETTLEAERKGIEMYSNLFQPDARFIKWK